ncbi:MAG: peroxiredoxin, partial [Planctomycetota bacterium]|nr:peroxiredoxin [Planctomycetota bacterium]
MHDPTRLPDDLPIPEDDGAASHLRLRTLPPIALRATNGASVDLSTLDRAVLFFYPRTGIPDQRP